jgi:transposase-like protein
MDHDVKAFRAAAGRENGSRTGLQRRYSPALRAQAVRCWQVRQRAGEALRDVAGALGVAPWSLHRWTRASPARARFHPVEVVAPERPTADARMVVVVGAESTRVEGLDVETAARLIALLR